MADTSTAEPQTGVPEAKEKVTEESTTSAEETPESDQGTSTTSTATTTTGKIDAATPASAGGGAKKSKNKPDCAKASSPEEKENGAKASTKEGETAAPDSTSPNDNEESKPESAAATPVVSASKKSRPPYKYDPEKITLRFLFANRDGLTVTVECNPNDCVGEVKGALLSVWPEVLPKCSGGDRIRLVCMGKGILMPDTRTLEDCQVPVFKTHPTPINVSVRPENHGADAAKSGGDGTTRRGASSALSGGNPGDPTNQGCACVIL